MGACAGSRRLCCVCEHSGETFDPGRFAWEATPGVLFKPVVGQTELTLPDDWPEFPTEPGTYHIGITSKDEMENQSDPFVSSAQFKFSSPASPMKGRDRQPLGEQDRLLELVHPHEKQTRRHQDLHPGCCSPVRGQTDRGVFFTNDRIGRGEDRFVHKGADELC